MIGYAIIPIIVPLMAHNIFVLLQLLEYDRQESGMNIYNALKIKAQSVPDGHSHQISPIYFLGWLPDNCLIDAVEVLRIHQSMFG